MKKILIVDDDTDLLSSLKTLLSRHGYENIGTCNGLETIALTRLLHPDLILLDVQLGTQTGRIFAKT